MLSKENKKGPCVQVISSQKGRGLQMNVGAGCAVGEILMFLHADAVLPEK